MEVAIGINLNGFVPFCNQEIGLGFFPWLEEAEAAAFFGGEINPFNIMVVQHRMDNRTNFNVNEVAVLLGDRDMFLNRGFHGAGFDFLHHLAAARWIASDLIEFGDDRAAEHALIELDHIVSLALEIAQKTQMPIFLS